MKKVAVYTGTRNLYKHMVPAVKALLYNSDVNEVWLFIEDDEFPYEIPKDVVNVRNVSGQTYFPKDGPNYGGGFTYMALMRAALAKEFQRLKRVLSLDVDTFPDADISDIWDLPIDKCYFAASYEPVTTKMKGYFYTNIGVCLYNLKKLRDGKCDEAIKALNEKEYKYMEQDVFNEICQGAIYDMPSEYNVTRFTLPTDNPKLIHFAADWFWYDREIYKKYTRLTWEEVMEHRKQVYGL